MTSNKNRLYIAVHTDKLVNNEEPEYYWGFMIGPKTETGDSIASVRYHVRNSPFGLKYEEIPSQNVRAISSLLARIVIAKIEDETRLIALLRQVSVVQDDSNYDHHTWVVNALAEIMKDGQCVGTAELDWQKIEAFAIQYVRDKIASGRYRSVENAVETKPTWDMLENKETML